MKPKLWSIFLVSMVLATQTSAFALSCDGGIVSVGDLASKVVHKCGQPTYASQREQNYFGPIAGGFILNTVKVDDWVYNFGPNKFQWTDAQLTFINAQVAALPARLKRSIIDQSVKGKVFRMPIEDIDAVDP